MITNEKQYRSARAAIDRLSTEFSEVSAAQDGVHPMLRQAQLAGLKSQIAELAEEADQYDGLRSGKVTAFEAEGLRDLPEILIKARIARGMSQRELGQFIGVAEQQIQRYEAERYRSANLERLSEIASALDIRVREAGELRVEASGRDVGDDPLAYPITEMFKRGYFEDFSGTLAQAKKAADRLVPAFFQASTWAPNALHRRSVRAGSSPQQAALLAWEARVSTLAERRAPLGKFHRSALDRSWLRHLVGLSIFEDGPQRAEAWLRESGVVLVVEPHLPGTLLDGAALRTGGDVFVVALTIRHDRLDNFWFTLLHEVGHLALHISAGQYQAIFDETETPDKSPIEDEADLFAQEALLPSELWKTCVSRFTRTDRAVQTDAAKLGVHPAIIAGRIRREAGDYTLFRNLVGAGEVRRQFHKGREG